MPEMSVLEDTEPSRTRHIVKTVRSDSTPPVAKKGGDSPLGTRDLCKGKANSPRLMRGRPTAAFWGREVSGLMLTAHYSWAARSVVQ